MGAVALRREPRSASTRRPRLAVVSPAPPRSGARATRRVRVDKARQLFASFAVLAVVVAVLGVGRVWLSVQAAEASRAATELRDDLKAERYAGDMLEIRQSALGSPSRILGIAGATMSMRPAGRVTYVRLEDGSPQPPRVRVQQARRSELQRVVAGMMDLTAGEAQVLLVGSVGLGSQK